MSRCVPETVLDYNGALNRILLDHCHARATSQLLKNHCIYSCLFVLMFFQDAVHSKKSIHAFQPSRSIWICCLGPLKQVPNK